jgi:serine/threonine protein kinase
MRGDDADDRTVCTENYRALELFQGKVPYSFSVDVWSAGIIMEMYLGQSPLYSLPLVGTGAAAFSMTSKMKENMEADPYIQRSKSIISDPHAHDATEHLYFKSK